MAYQLSGEGYNTVVIDKRDIGAGSTSATTAMIQYEIDTPLYKLIRMMGAAGAIDVYKEGVRAIDQLSQIVDVLPNDSGFDLKQSIYVAYDRSDVKGLRKEFESRKSAGLDVDWLSKEQIFSTYGMRGEGAIISEAAASMDAYQLTHTLFQYSIRQYSANVFDHTEVTAVDSRNDNNYVAVDTGARIVCKTIVYATGYETHQIISKGIGKLLSTYACVSEPVDRLPEKMATTIFWNTEDPYFYFRTTRDNRIVIGGADVDFKNPERRDALLEKKEQYLVEKFKEVVPDLPFIADFSWAGTFGATKDGLPYIGRHPDFKNSYFLLGFGGNGITFSVMGMKIISDAVAKRENRFLEYFKFMR